MRHHDIEALLPDVSCTCNLEARQAEASKEARMYNHDLPKLWHSPACHVAARTDLRNVLIKISDMEGKAVLPDPVLERLEGVAMAELIAQRDGLLHRLTGTTTAPRRQVTGYNRLTGGVTLTDTQSPTKESST